MKQLIPVALVALLIGLTACDPERSAGLTPDSITIRITGLPADLEPYVTLTDPSGYEQAIAETRTLEELEAGVYTISAQAVEFRGNPFDPDRETHQLMLEPGGSKSVTVVYAPHRTYSQGVLEHLNLYRVGAQLPPVTLDANGSLPNWLHVRYIAENNRHGHTQDPTHPWAHPDGAKAGAASNVSTGYGEPRDNPTWVMHSFGQAPFHLMSLLDPRTTAVRLGYYHATSGCLEGDDWCGPISSAALEPVRTGTWPAGRKVYFPGEGQTIDMLDFWGEYPSPAGLCPTEYQTSPSGLPLFVARGWGITPRIENSSLTTNGVELEHCIVRGTTDYGAGAEEAAFAADLLQGYGATILLPLEPLEPLSSYTVTFITSDGEEQWTFHTGDVTITPFTSTNIN